MKIGHAYYISAKAILESRDLVSPGGPVQFLPKQGEHSELYKLIPGEASIYIIRFSSMLSHSRGVLVLFAAEPDAAGLKGVLQIQRALEATSAVCVTSHSGSPLDGLTTWSPSELFRNLLSIPTAFSANLRDVATVQRVNEFPLTYQSREAIVHSTPSGRNVTRKEDLDAYLREWLSDRSCTAPILLLGERGSGKSWQVLRFAEEAYELNRIAPWACGPAFLVRLSGLVNLLDQATAATPLVCEYLFSEYPELTSAFDRNRICGAFLTSGHAVLCADGFDEMDMLPTDMAVRARFASLLSVLTKKTRFVLTCRPGHFSSLQALLSMPAWPGVRVKDAFNVLEMLPFDDQRKRGYLEKAQASFHRIPQTLNLLGDDAGPLARGLSICTQYPGLLAQIAEMSEEGTTDVAQLIGNAIRRSFTEFNIHYARTIENYQSPSGDWVDLSIERREQLLAEMSWYMAVRNLDAIDLNDLPLQFRLDYQITDDALQRDLRSQTVLELVETEESPQIEDLQNRTSLVRFALRDEDVPSEDTDSSVAGAYYLSRHIADRFAQPGPFGAVRPEIQLSFLGRVRLGPLAGALLKERLISLGSTPEYLGQSGKSLLVRLAKMSGGRVFSPFYRHLATNLATLGALHTDEAQSIDPWSTEIRNVIRDPPRMPGYHMALLPAPPNSDSDAPFLMGVHEVTNRQYLQFLSDEGDGSDDTSVCGRQWTVSRMTLAGAGEERNRSANYVLSNEYHLFFWAPDSHPKQQPTGLNEDADELEYLPNPDSLDHPVSYVSWYASAAFCDWLSMAERRNRYYRNDLYRALGRNVEESPTEESRHAYRLPRKSEWFWAARAGHDDVRWPWELFPYYLAPEERLKVVTDAIAWKRYQQEQHIVQQILVDTGKQSYPVLADEPNELGVAGLIGNVREWCDDTAEMSSDMADASTQRFVLGSTGYLGHSTFDLNREYRAPLYPRNTNPDVGFRLARTLDRHELDSLRARERQIGDR